MGKQAKYKAAQVVLGPTVNLHRDPRAGRNFEAFSEDPVLTGHMAVALVNGIQSQGVGTCVRHFVCNESETLRKQYSSDVDERTLREIYLAPFQWLVREAKPTAIMTSLVYREEGCSLLLISLLGIINSMEPIAARRH